MTLILKHNALIALFALILPFASALAQQSSVEGLWRSEDGEGIVEVAPCAQGATPRCGKIVWIKKPLDDKGRPIVDAKNPNAALKTRPICGIEILSGLKPNATGGFDGGTIYDPEEGKTYTGAMVLAGDKLKVTGSIEMPVVGPLSDSENWTRVTTAFERCTGAPKK